MADPVQDETHEDSAENETGLDQRKRKSKTEIDTDGVMRSAYDLMLDGGRRHPDSSSQAGLRVETPKRILDSPESLHLKPYQA